MITITQVSNGFRVADGRMAFTTAKAEAPAIVAECNAKGWDAGDALCALSTEAEWNAIVNANPLAWED